MHSYEAPSGIRYHLDAEGSVTGRVHFENGAEEMAVIPMRDILFLAALHKRDHLTSLAENSSDFKVLGLPEGDL